MAKSDDVGGDRLEASFVFVKHGDPMPREWMARHPDWVRFPATLVVRREEQASARKKAPGELPLEDLAGSAEGMSRMERPVALGAPVRRRRVTPINRLSPWHTGDGSAATTHQDAIAAYRQATQILDQAPAIYLASAEARSLPDKKIKDARERAFLHLLRWEENGDVTDDFAYHNRFGGHDPMTDEQMRHYEPEEEVLIHKNGKRETVTAAGAYQINSKTWKDVGGKPT